MASFRYYDPGSVYLNILGTDHLTQGSLTFYEIGTTTPKNTWSDAALTVLNTNPLNLDGSGRIPDDVFLDGEYTVKLTDGPDGSGTTIWTRDVISGSDDATAIPALEDGKFLTNDGATLQWDTVLQVADPTGQTGKVLTSTGASYTWQSIPAAVQPAIQVTATSVSLDDGGSAPNKMLMQMGTGTCPTAGGRHASVSIVFPVAYDSPPPWVDCVVRTFPLSAFQNMPSHSVTAKSTTGATFQFTMGELDDGQAGFDFNANIDFDYIAIGIIP